MVENVECRGRFRVKWSCWPPSDVQELLIEVYTMTSALIDSNMVDAVGVYDPKSGIGG